MGVVDDNLDLLQNIEFTVISGYRKDRTIEDRNVIKVYEALIGHQRQVARGRTPREPENLSETEQIMFDAVQEIVDMRRQLEPPTEKPRRFSIANKVETFEDKILACFRKVPNFGIKSVASKVIYSMLIILFDKFESHYSKFDSSILSGSSIKKGIGCANLKYFPSGILSAGVASFV